MSIKVVIFEDNIALKSALSALIEGTDGYQLSGAFGDCLKAKEFIADLKPDVILMDIELPKKDGLQAVKELHQLFPSIEILMLTIFDDDDRIFDALRFGATGYLLKSTPPARILEAISEVYEGGAPMSPSVARKVLKRFPQSPGKSTELHTLTKRELEVLKLLSKGHSYKMIASDLNIGIETVRTYIKHIYDKLHVHSVTEAVVKYLK